MSRWTLVLEVFSFGLIRVVAILRSVVIPALSTGWKWTSVGRVRLSRAAIITSPTRLGVEIAGLRGCTKLASRRFFASDKDIRCRWYEALLEVVPSAAALKERIVSSGLSILGRVGLDRSGSAVVR